MDDFASRHPAPFPVAVSWLGVAQVAAAAWADGTQTVETAVPAGGVLIVLLRPEVPRDVLEIETSLSASERVRRDGIQHPRAYAEFHAGRRLIRVVLGKLLGVGPAEVRLLESERGALSLDPNHGCRLRFNLSHTEGLVVLAVAETDVGVDVEWLDRPGRTVELADRYFAPSEVASLKALPEVIQRDRFFDLWTLKESYIKARGLGLAMPLAKFAFAGFGGALTLAVDPAHADRPDSAWASGVWQTGRHRIAVTLGR